MSHASEGRRKSDQDRLMTISPPTHRPVPTGASAVGSTDDGATIPDDAQATGSPVHPRSAPGRPRVPSLDRRPPGRSSRRGRRRRAGCLFGLMRRSAEDLFQVYTEDEFLAGVGTENTVGPTSALADEPQRRCLAVAAMLVGALAGVVWVILIETQPLAGLRTRVAGAGQRRPVHRARLEDASIAGRIRFGGAQARATAN